jgi:hypothetical protein
MIAYEVREETIVGSLDSSARIAYYQPNGVHRGWFQAMVDVSAPLLGNAATFDAGFHFSTGSSPRTCVTLGMRRRGSFYLHEAYFEKRGRANWSSFVAPPQVLIRKFVSSEMAKRLVQSAKQAKSSSIACRRKEIVLGGEVSVVEYPSFQVGKQELNALRNTPNSHNSLPEKCAGCDTCPFVHLTFVVLIVTLRWLISKSLRQESGL